MNVDRSLGMSSWRRRIVGLLWIAAIVLTIYYGIEATTHRWYEPHGGYIESRDELGIKADIHYTLKNLSRILTTFIVAFSVDRILLHVWFD